MNKKDKPFNFKSIDEIYNYVEVESKNSAEAKNVIRPENINVIKDNDSEIVLLMSYKKPNQNGTSSQSQRYSYQNGDQNPFPEPNHQKLASTIKYLTKGIESDDSIGKNDSLEQNIRGIFNNSQNPYFKPPTLNVDEIRSTDTLNSNQIRKMTEPSTNLASSFDEKVLKPLTTKSHFLDSKRTKTKIPLPERLKPRDKKMHTPPPVINTSVTNKVPIKHRYFALCIPNMVNDPSSAYSIESHFQTLRYFNPSVEEFKKPNNNEIVAVPVNVVAKPGNQLLTAGDSNNHNPGDKIELTMEELHTIVKLVKERNII